MTHVAIPRRALIASASFAADLDAQRVAQAIARGLQARGAPEPDVCPLEPELPARPAELLDALDFDARMRGARAVIVADPRLHEGTLAGSATFEIATRARQGGVPTYGVTGENVLSRFDLRLLDLQLILEAHTAGALASAGRRLAELM